MLLITIPCSLNINPRRNSYIPHFVQHNSHLRWHVRSVAAQSFTPSFTRRGGTFFKRALSRWYTKDSLQSIALYRDNEPLSVSSRKDITEMGYFLPSFFQKRILYYALSRIGWLDIHALDLDKLDIVWGKRSTVELQDVGLRLAVRLYPITNPVWFGKTPC